MALTSKKTIITVEKIQKKFLIGTQEVEILKNISFTINEGDFSIIIGPSGCGKSTLLHIILGLEEPTSGRITMLGDNLYENKNDDDRSEFRKHHVGMVYQQANWIKALNVIENVSFPLVLLGQEKELAKQKALEELKKLKMEEWATYHPSELSGGQQQRIALARALINNPEIIIADEPTGNLDFQAGQNVMQLLHDMSVNQGKTVIMVTHDLEYLRFAKTAIRMFDGEVTGIFEGNEKEKLLGDIRTKRGVISSDKEITEENDQVTTKSVKSAKPVTDKPDLEQTKRMRVFSQR